MNTGPVDNWVNIDTFGAIYPFIGSEVLLAILGYAFWIIWHIIQVKRENAEFRSDIENIKRQGGPGTVLEDEARREIEAQVGQ